MLHRIRLMLVRQRTMLTNTIRAHMAEFGVVAPIGQECVSRQSSPAIFIPGLARALVI